MAATCNRADPTVRGLQPRCVCGSRGGGGGARLQRGKSDAGGPAIGELVDAKWPEDGRFYSAIVLAGPASGTGAASSQYTVRFDDGLTLALPLGDLRRLVYRDDAVLAAARRISAALTEEQFRDHAIQLLESLSKLKQGRYVCFRGLRGPCRDRCRRGRLRRSAHPRNMRRVTGPAPGGGGHRRYVAALFQDLPDRTEFADYFKIIKHPVALNDIRVRRPSTCRAVYVARD